MRLQLFEKLAEKAGLPKKLVLDAARETAEKTREAWKKNKAHYALPSDIEKVVDEHMRSAHL